MGESEIRKVLDWADGVYWETLHDYENDAGIPIPDFIMGYLEWQAHVLARYFTAIKDKER